MEPTTWQFMGVLIAIGANLMTTVYFLARIQAKVEILEKRIDELRGDIRELRSDLNNVIRRIDRSNYVPKE